MIPDDSYTRSVIVLLVMLGVLGLVLPDWFTRISRFPFIFDEKPPSSPASRRRARVWAIVSLAGAAFLLLAIWG